MSETTGIVQPDEATENNNSSQDTKKAIKVGLIMPIAEIVGLNEHHWEDVRRIIREALKDIAEYEVDIRLVSDSDEVRVIQSNIVRNIYSDEIVIIDVSAKNPNVMFEFGLRLAFDMPFVVIKDDATPFIFDTGNIQHLEYPRDLRYTKIEEFKRKLRHKVISTLKYKEENPNKSLYLEEYGNLVPKKINEVETDMGTYMKKMVNELKFSLNSENKPVKINEHHLRREIKEILYEYESNLNQDVLAVGVSELNEYVINNIGNIGNYLSKYTIQSYVREILEGLEKERFVDSLPF
ncbi:hypothetical protein [Lysinibacillus sp. NPDC086135]|uniref:hypothetical protein n=1 Tax=Lysinibacillus sp. NPDC086135 TaxID=3364130 RepID=UPI0038020988